MKWLLYFHEKIGDEMNKLMMIFFLVFNCCLSYNNTYAQKASFINGNFIVAFYSEHDKQVKFVNTYTTQAFAWFSYTGSEPRLWFTGTQLVVVNEKEAIVSGLESNSKKNYTLTGKPIQNTIWQWNETDSFIHITHIISQKQIASLGKEHTQHPVNIFVSGDEKIIMVAYAKGAQINLSYYNIALPAPLWQKEINTTNELVLSLNNTGNLIAVWNGSNTTLLSAADGSIVQTIGNQFQVLRFTAKDELICMNLENPKAVIFTKTKTDQLKASAIATYKSGIFVRPDGKESVIEWDIRYVSDDLTMAVGFGNKVVGLYKNGPSFLFY